MHNPNRDNGQGNPPYKHCLNCGSELKGMYCHNCGQEAVNKTPSVMGFVAEYLNNAFIWDSQFFKTFWTLIRRPGQLTNEFLAGKFASQEHPLKLNMFLLFVFISLFIAFGGHERMTGSVHSMTNDERVLSGVQFKLLLDNPEYVKKMQESPRDTILLAAPLFFANEHSEFISKLEVKEDTAGEGIDKWIAILPRVLIEDKVLLIDNEGCYRFDTEAEAGRAAVDIINSVWTEIVSIVSQYLPMLLLLTAPFLSISLGLVQRKSKLPPIHHFIFALHYTALLEFLMICIYILHLTVAPSIRVMEWIMIISSCAYLAVAFRRVYATCTWVSAIVKSLLTSLVYLVILLFISMVILLIACFIIVSRHI